MRYDNSGRTSRREVLRAGLATAGVLALGPRALGSPSAGDAGYGPFKMGIQSYSLRHFKLAEALDKTRELGLSYWESYRDHIPPDPDQIPGMRKEVEARGVQVVGYGVIKFTKDHEANRKIFEFAKELGISYLSADPDPASFESLDELVDRHGVSIGIHNHGPGHRYGTIDAIAEAIQGHHDRIGCCIDTGHFLRSQEDPLRAVEVFAGRIHGVHLKDVKDATEFTILGKGDLRTADFLRALERQGYDDCVALEYEENKAAPMDDIRACLTEIRRAVGSL